MPIVEHLEPSVFARQAPKFVALRVEDVDVFRVVVVARYVAKRKSAPGAWA